MIFTEREQFNAIIGLSIDAGGWPTTLLDSNYTCFAIEYEFINQKDESINPDIIFVRSDQKVCIFVECKSGKNIEDHEARQLRRYYDLNTVDISRQAGVPIDPEDYVSEVVILGTDENWQDLIEGYKAHDLEPCIISLGAKEIKIRQGRLSDEGLNRGLEEGIDVEGQMIPNWLVPILPSSPESEVASMVIDAIIEIIVKGSLLRVAIETIGQEAFAYGLWNVLSPNAKQNMRKRIKRIIDNLCRTEFIGEIRRVGGKGKNPPEWSILTSMKGTTTQKRAGYYKYLMQAKIAFINRLRIDEGQGLLSVPEDMDFDI